MWSNTDYLSFIREITSNYEAVEMDVSRMVDDEIASVIEYRKLDRQHKKSQTNRITAQDIKNAVELCQSWLNEPRLTIQDLTPAYVASHRRSTIYFQLLQPRGGNYAK